MGAQWLKQSYAKSNMFTTYQIHKEGLLLNHKGEPYRHRGTLTKVLATIKPAKVVQGPYGLTKYYSQKQLDALNKRYEV
jgi:hypothetical protein